MNTIPRRKRASQRVTLLRLAVLCLFLLVSGHLIFTPNFRKQTRKQTNAFLREKQSHFTKVGRAICNQEIFNSYLNLHNLEVGKKSGRFFIYHVLDDDVFGMGCRMTGALYALALSISTGRALILSGDEFKYIFSTHINYTKEYLVRRAHVVLRDVGVGELVSKKNTTFMKIEITSESYKNAKEYFMGDSLSQVNILYATSISSHRHIDRLMAEDIDFRKYIIKIFGNDFAAYSKENRHLMSKHRYKLVPAYPTVWRHFWGCAQWFLFDKIHPKLEKSLAQSFRSTNSEPCEKLVSIHFRGGDTNFAGTHSRRDKSKDLQVENMIDRWLSRMRTPIEALDIFLLYANRFSHEFQEVKVCYFVASDDARAYNLTKKYVGKHDVLHTFGTPEHSSLSKSRSATIKALTDYVILGMSDVLVHGTSTYSESAIERTFGKNIEVRCRSPQKKLWADSKSWYCIQNGKKVDRIAQNTLAYLKKNYPSLLFS